jgi:ribosomal protein S18 acetylase RimI-like enzyme
MTASDVVRIREAAPADAAVVAAFNAAMARETEGRALDPATVLAGVAAVLGDPARGFYLVAEVAPPRPGADGAPIPPQVVGQVLVTSEWSDWRNGWFWWIQSVYVRPDFRGRHVFTALHRGVTRRARARGDVIGLRLYVARDNAAARSVYRRLGLDETAYRLFEADWGGR